MRYWFAHVVLSLVYCLPAQLWAKGIETLKPSTEPEQIQEAEPQAQQEPAKDEGKVKTQAQPAKKIVEPTPVAAAADHGVNKRIANNIFLTLGIGIVNGVKLPTAGNAAAVSVPDISGLFKIPNKENGLAGTWAVVRYQSIELSVERSNIRYRGVADSYMVGAQQRLSLWPKTEAVYGAELGYTVLRLRKLDVAKPHHTITPEGVVFAGGGGLEWVAREKIYWGPRIYAMLGYVQTIKLSVQFAFLF